MEDEETATSRFGRIKIPPILGRLVPIGANSYLPIEELIRNNLDVVFVGHRITNSTLFRVTRNADFEVSEGAADDLLAAVEEELRQRRFGRAVRLEIERGAPREVIQLLLTEMELERDSVEEVSGTLNLGIALDVAALDLPSLKSPRWAPVVPTRIANAHAAADGGADVFALIDEGDLLVHHPYESFDASVDRFFAQAAADPNVLSIKCTLYRTGEGSSIPTHLIKAAEAGKEVVVLVELKARFDEAANIAWGRMLEDAGAHVIYGMMGLKTHCKATLIVRREGGRVRRYSHLSTGNYNPKTARLYTDLGIFTSDDSIGADLGRLFNYLTGLAKHPAYDRLLVAPDTLRAGLTSRIEAAIASAAAGGHPSITAKVNALVDRRMIELLDRAAASGVKVDLIVRGMCGLLPDKSRHGERLRIRSIVGELLEHSRIFRFEIDGGTEWLAGSADLMDRNLDRRVEVLFPLLGAESQRRAEQIVSTLLADTRNSWILQPDGAWIRSEELDPTAPSRSAFHELKHAASDPDEAA
jgi:polyphosphate kinase